MKEQTACFTGHRQIPEKELPQIREKVRATVLSLIREGYEYFGAGGALGFDTIAAQTVLELQKEHPQIKLILILPHKGQENAWSEEDKAIYWDIFAHADKIVYTAEAYFRGCMQKRNRHLVEYSSVCICYLTENRGGTLYTVNYAKKHNLRIINVAD